MSYYFTTTFLTALASAAPTGNVKLYMFPTAPTLTESEGDTVTPSYAAINSVDDLAATLGWGPYIEGPAIAMTSGSSGTLHWIETTASFDLDDAFPTTRIEALAFVTAAGQIMFVTDTSLGPGMVLTNKDGIFAAEDTTTSANVLFSWNTPPTGQPANAVEGALRVLKGAPDFETANTQHIWVYPQRVNFIANPSFELGTDFWRANGDLAQRMTAPPGGGYASGRVSGAAPLILESNQFPLNYGHHWEAGWTIQLKARGTGILKVGLISWDASFSQTASQWGPVGDDGKPLGWALQPDAYTYIRTLRPAGETVTGMLRLECDGGWFEIDQVCVEPGLLPANEDDWPYFDGEDQYAYGAKGDFSWYGGTARAHTTYSFWYNLRLSTFGRLFALCECDTGADTDDTVFSDDDALKQGLAYQWVPAGTPVMYHLDVLYPNDPSSPLSPVTGDVLDYQVSDTDALGVRTPW